MRPVTELKMVALRLAATHKTRTPIRAHERRIGISPRPLVATGLLPGSSDETNKARRKPNGGQRGIKRLEPAAPGWRIPRGGWTKANWSSPYLPLRLVTGKWKQRRQEL